MKARTGFVVALDDGVLDGRDRGLVGGQGAVLGDPLAATAVEQADVLVAEQGEHPEGVRRPPVVLVAVDHDGGAAADALAAEELGEGGTVDVVALHRVVEVGVPVDLHGARDVPRLVEQDVLVGLDDHQVGGAGPGVELLLQPLGGDEALRVRVGGELLGRVDRCGHRGYLQGVRGSVVLGSVLLAPD